MMNSCYVFLFNCLKKMFVSTSLQIKRATCTLNRSRDPKKNNSENNVSMTLSIEMPLQAPLGKNTVLEVLTVLKLNRPSCNIAVLRHSRCCGNKARLQKACVLTQSVASTAGELDFSAGLKLRTLFVGLVIVAGRPAGQRVCKAKPGGQSRVSR